MCRIKAFQGWVVKAGGEIAIPSRLVVLWILSVNTESIIVATELGIKEEKCVQEKEIISCYDKETQIWHPGLLGTTFRNAKFTFLQHENLVSETIIIATNASHFLFTQKVAKRCLREDGHSLLFKQAVNLLP